MQTKPRDLVAREVERAISDYVERRNKRDFQQMYEAAAAWQKDELSMMRAFVRNNGRLDKSSDYKILAAEARVALRELEAQKSGNHEIWGPSLAKLHDFAYHTDQATRQLRTLSRVAASVTQSGVHDRYVRGIVACAVKQALRNWS